MKIELEICTSMSRPETFRALQIVLDAADRLRHRMTNREFEKLSAYGAALIRLAKDETASRKHRRGDRDRIAAGPPLIEEIAQ